MKSLVPLRPLCLLLDLQPNMGRMVVFLPLQVLVLENDCKKGNLHYHLPALMQREVVFQE